jgi:drug/metabolite transporter (DMT)-like permease
MRAPPERSPSLPPRVALAALHVAVALFGFAALFGEWIALPATLIVLGRTVVAAATLGVVARVRGVPLRRPGLHLAANGAILALHWVAFFAAVQAAGVALALFGYATFPVFALLLERPGAGHARRDFVTASLACLGLVTIVPDPSWSAHATRGLALGVVAGFTFAWLAVRNRRLVALRAATQIAFWQNAAAALCLLPVALALDLHVRLPTPAEAGLLVALGVFCTGLAHTLFISSMRSVSAQTASVVAALEPVYGVVLAAALLHELPTPRTIAGGLLIVAAALAASRGVSVGMRRSVSVASKAGEPPS